jgi:hypothetical protein
VEWMREMMSAIFIDGTQRDRARAYRALWRICLAAFMLSSFGLFSSLHVPGFARADEVDVKIAKAVEPLAAQFADVQLQLSRLTDVQKQSRVDQLGSILRELHRACCAVPRSDVLTHERMVAEIERAQREYRVLTGERYPLPEKCDATD